MVRWLFLCSRAAGEAVGAFDGTLESYDCALYHPYSGVGARLYACSISLLVLFGLPHVMSLLQRRNRTLSVAWRLVTLCCLRATRGLASVQTALLNGDQRDTGGHHVHLFLRGGLFDAQRSECDDASTARSVLRTARQPSSCALDRW